MNTTEFDEIRPYNDDELPQIFEELIADPAFQKAACPVLPCSFSHKQKRIFSYRQP